MAQKSIRTIHRFHEMLEPLDRLRVDNSVTKIHAEKFMLVCKIKFRYITIFLVWIGLTVLTAMFMI